MNSVLEAVAPMPSTIIPGTQTFEDLEAFLKRKKSEKLEEMKKKLWSFDSRATFEVLANFSSWDYNPLDQLNSNIKANVIGDYLIMYLYL